MSQTQRLVQCATLCRFRCFSWQGLLYGESALEAKSLGVLQALTFRCSSSQQHDARLAQVPFSGLLEDAGLGHIVHGLGGLHVGRGRFFPLDKGDKTLQ